MRIYKENRAKRAIPWNPKMKWEKYLNIKAETYTVPIELFPKLRPVKVSHPTRLNSRLSYEKSPSGTWCYVRQIFPSKEIISTCIGSRQGDVMFDDDVIFPTLWHNKGHNYMGGWTDSPFMSLTPFEVFTLRTGTRRAKGHTVVAGLGLGYQLAEVTKKKSVKKVTLVEVDEELVDWLLPIIKPHLGECELSIEIGDANKVLPKLTADVALIDIYPSYGGNTFDHECKNIPTIWVWGSANIG